MDIFWETPSTQNLDLSKWLETREGGKGNRKLHPPLEVSADGKTPFTTLRTCRVKGSKPLAFPTMR